ncbi:hypothetical protein D9M73_113070 [compost metagenome]
MPPLELPPLLPPENRLASDEKPAFLLNSTCVTLPVASTVGLPTACAAISSSRACRTRDAAIAIVGLSFSARSTSAVSVESPKAVHQRAGSIAAPGTPVCGSAKAAGTAIAGA